MMVIMKIMKVGVGVYEVSNAINLNPLPKLLTTNLICQFTNE